MANLSNINNKFLVTTGGDVGIGVTSPSSLLTLNAISGAALQWQYNGGNYLRIEADSGGGSYYAAAGFYHRFFTSGLERMRIDSSGNVDIGTGAASDTYVRIYNASSGDITAGYQIYNGSNLDLNIYTNPLFGNSTFYSRETFSFNTSAGAKVKILNNGNVGIGTNLPSYNLVVSSGGASGVEFAIATATGLNEMLSYNRSTSVFEKFRAQAKQFEWYTDATANALVIQSGGNVGIGTDSPDYKLDIEGTSPRIRVKETSSNTSATMVEVENSDGRGAMLGIGGSGRTDILANRGYINAQSETDGLAIGTEGTDPILFYTQGVATSNERMRIDSLGNVGIGATNPGEKLTVSGDGRFTGGSAGTLTIKHNYGYQQPNWGIKLDGDTGRTGGYLSQYINLGGFALEQGGTYYGGGPWKTDANSTSYSSVNGKNGEIIFYTNTSLTANTVFNPSERMRITSSGALAFSGSANYGAAGEVLTSNGNAAPSWQAAGGSSPWTTTGNDIYNNNTGSVGINNTTPSSHPSNRNTLVVGSGVNSGSGTADAGITIFTAPSVFPNQDYATLAFASNTNSYNSANFEFKYLNRDNNQFADSNPSLVLYKGGDKFIGITEQSNQSFIPRIVLQPNYYNSSITAGNLDQALVTIPLNSGLNYPGVAINGDSQGNSNPFIGMVSTSSSSQITTKFIRFYHNTTLCGTIQKRYNANEVQYLTTSDYRLKEDLKPFKALDTICKINVYNYKWKDIEGDNINYGVLAHELQELIPEVVAGEKDEVNKKGEEEYQSVDYSKLVPHLIQSIQELKAEIELLKSK